MTESPKIDPALVEPIHDPDRPEVAAFIAKRWGSPRIITRARAHDASELPGFLLHEDGAVVGAITLSVQGPECEVVTIDSAVEGRGIGSAMLVRAEEWAAEHGCDRMWLVTTNDNLRALYFYQRQGYRIMAVHRDAVTRTRELKPETPEFAANGIRICDELELEKLLTDEAPLY